MAITVDIRANNKKGRNEIPYMSRYQLKPVFHWRQNEYGWICPKTCSRKKVIYIKCIMLNNFFLNFILFSILLFSAHWKNLQIWKNCHSWLFLHSQRLLMLGYTGWFDPPECPNKIQWLLLLSIKKIKVAWNYVQVQIKKI